MTDDWVIKQLICLPSSRKLKQHEKYCMICCPFHKEGKETNPSMKIKTTQDANPGSFICFSCGKKGEWNLLAPELGLKKNNSSVYSVNLLDEKQMSKLLGKEEDENFDRKEIENLELFPKNQKWRGIDGWLLRKIGAKVIFNTYGTRVYLPVKMNGEWISGISASWYKTKAAYINDPEPEIVNCWFPYDYTKKICSRSKPLFLVEGPRDALNLLQNKIPALANIGGKHSWRNSKVESVLDLKFNTLVLSNDPDEVGQELNRLQYEAFKSRVTKIKVFKMNNGDKKEDPGNLSPDRIAYIKQTFGLE